jgi:hypothetical protein
MLMPRHAYTNAQQIRRDRKSAGYVRPIA